MKKIYVAVAGLMLVKAGSVAAIQPASVSAGPLEVIPVLETSVSHNDNIYGTETNETEAVITTVSPSVQVVAERANDAYRLTYGFDAASYSKGGSFNNYVDHNLQAEAMIELNSRNDLYLSAGINKGHDDRDSGDVTNNTKLTRWTDKTLNAQYNYGAEGAQGNLELNLSYVDHSYDSNKAANIGQAKDSLLLGGVFYYRVAPKTKALLELRSEKIDYTDAASQLDNTEQTVLTGVTWEATAKTSGSAKIGYQEKGYDSASRKDEDGVTWEIGATWAPRTYSTFDLNTRQSYEETSGDENESAIDTSVIGLSWNHAWNDRFSTKAGVNFTNEEYVGAANGREDDTADLNLGATYEMRRWLDLSAGYTYSDTDSNVSGNSSTNNVFMLTLTGSL
ncbi:MAG: outer membrane beta-barrel protein [Pontibacterium sp.]